VLQAVHAPEYSQFHVDDAFMRLVEGLPEGEATIEDDRDREDHVAFRAVRLAKPQVVVLPKPAT
jgi:hypothetical protein